MLVLNTKSLVVFLMIFGTLQAATKSKCDIVRALRAKGVYSDSDLRNWLCLVDKESSFVYTAKNRNRNGSYDYGLFQLNNRYWCDRNPGYSGTTCWKLRTDGCQYSCNSFLNSDISDDVDCAVRIKNCDGFIKWNGWKNKCRGKNLNISKYDPTGC